MNREFHHWTLNNCLSLLQEYYSRRKILRISMRSDGSQREWPYVKQLALQRTAAGIGAYILSSRRVEGLDSEENRRRAPAGDTACAPVERARIHQACLSTEWVIVRNNTTIWPIRDLTTLLFPTLPLQPSGVDARLSCFHSLVSFGSPTSHRFNGDPCHDPTSRACVHTCVRASVRACRHACLRARTHTHARTWRSDDACTCRIVYFKNPT